MFGTRISGLLVLNEPVLARKLLGALGGIALGQQDACACACSALESVCLGLREFQLRTKVTYFWAAL